MNYCAPRITERRNERRTWQNGQIFVKRDIATELGVTLRDALQLVGFAFDAPFPRLEEARQRGKLGLAFQWQIIPRSQRRRQRLTGAAVEPVAVRVATWTERQEKHLKNISNKNNQVQAKRQIYSKSYNISDIFKPAGQMRIPNIARHMWTWH